jgi:hypothetical protein
MTGGEKSILFLGAGFLILSCIAFKRGQSSLSVCWLIGAFGCAVMLYAGHTGGKRRKG